MIPSDAPGIIEAAAGAVVALGTWLVRLEAKSNATQKDLAAKSIKDDKYNDDIRKDLLEIKVSLARLETKMESK